MKDKKVLLGGLIGGLLIIIFALGILLIINGTVFGGGSTQGMFIISLAAILLAPFAGGFLAGKIARSNPRLSGLLAGLAAGLFIAAAWLFISGFSLETLLSSLIILFTWVILARLASGFTSK